MSTWIQITKYLILFLTLIPFAIFALIAGLVNRKSGWQVIRIWNRLFAYLFNIKLEIEFEGDAKDLDKGGVLVGLTQQSIIDPTLAYAAINRHWLSIWNIEYAMIPFVGWVSWILGWVIVRQWANNSQHQLAKAANYASTGGLVYLSAEGKRSQDGSINPYKKGPAVMAIQAKTQIIPAYIHGSRNCLPYGEWKIKPGTVVCRILKPIDVSGMSYEDRDKVTEELIEIGAKEKLREPLYANP